MTTWEDWDPDEDDVDDYINRMHSGAYRTATVCAVPSLPSKWFLAQLGIAAPRYAPPPSPRESLFDLVWGAAMIALLSICAVLVVLLWL